MSRLVLCDTTQEEEVFAQTPQPTAGLSAPLVGPWCSERAPERVRGQPPSAPRGPPWRTAMAPGSYRAGAAEPPTPLAATTEPCRFPSGPSTQPPSRALGQSPSWGTWAAAQPGQGAHLLGGSSPEHRLLLSFTHSLIHHGAALRAPALARQPLTRLPADPSVQPRVT